MKSFRSYPILLLTLPLAGGIYLSDTFFHSYCGLSLHVGILTFLTLILLISALLRSYRFRWLFGVVLFLWMMVLGSVLVQYEGLRMKPPWPAGKQIYQGIVLETPRERAKTFCCRMKVEGREVLIYFMKDSLSRQISPYDSLLFLTQLAMPKDSTSSRFDYARWLMRNGINGTGVVYRGQWRNAGTSSRQSIRRYAMQCRTSILKIIQEWNMPKEQGLIEALAVGYKDELTDIQRSQFSQAGISHVLALSGLHVGILWGLLICLFSPFRKRLVGRVWSWVVITIILWCYAFVTGLAASVVRAVAMCTLVELGRIRRSQISSLNILSAVAGGMLIYHPFYLYDVSFQLSFMAVFSICISYRPLCELFQPSNPLLSNIWKLICISLSAQIGTAPLVVSYFGSFPVYFLLGNLIITPLIPLILYLIVFSLLTSFIPFIQTSLLWLLQHLVQIVVFLTKHISTLPSSSVQFTSVSPLVIVWFYLLMATIIICINTRKRRDKILSLVVIWLGTVGLVISRLDV